MYSLVCCIKINVCKENKVMIQQEGKANLFFLILMKRKITCLLVQLNTQKAPPPTLHDATLLPGPEPQAEYPLLPP